MPSIAGLEKTSSASTMTKTAPVARDEFTRVMADQLLRSTRQYGRWKAVQEDDPARAMRIARFVVERHGLFSGRGRVSQDQMERFDRLTRDLGKEGIHLFTTSQLRRLDAPGTGIETAATSRPADQPSHAVEPSVEERYAQLDCFQFVAAVLEDNGIRYYGKHGVGNALIRKAVEAQKPSNCFLTGEGVTRLLSREALTVTVKGNAFERAWEALEPHLREGAILSFSSRRFGHTGIVGARDGRWVFIHSSGNAGDNQSYRVKEEGLAGEITSWLARAGSENDFLSITVGHVDKELAASYSRPVSSGSGPSEQAKVNLFA